MDSFMEAQTRRAGELMEGFIGQTLNFYENIKREDVFRKADGAAISRLLEKGVPQKGRPVDEVYREMMDDVYANTSLVQHPRCFACIPSPVSLFSWMGDVMTNAFDPHAGCAMNASAASCIERELIRWMCGLAGYPAGSGGLFVSGGSMANLTALTAARDARLTEAERTLAVAYVSDQTHSSIAKGLHIIGFRADQVRKIPSDANFRMDMEALRAAVRADLAAGRKPFAVIATAGTTNTGSVDPLPEIAGICQSYGMWMHVDGAFGASILLSQNERKRLDGIEYSDSLSWDAHKWLRQTYGCSMALVRDQSHLVRSFAVHPEYLTDAGAFNEAPDFWDLGPELTRPARSLKLWITLQVMGSEAMGQMIDHGCAMARLAEELIRRYPGWEIVSTARLGIVNFRCAPANIPPSRIDRLNQDIAREVTDSGYAQILTTELNGKRVLRMCTLHPETTEEDIRNTVRLLCESRAASRGQCRTA
ncbi:aminotransferase class V-fold PLP-dependent enzyme [Clostridium sp. AF18-27]|uniref:pyridoxal phosphate-dependent decarboxylase family protein n=1 Tax=Enterocloster lavalensis TaxID=460384 RepID=UPI000E512FE3|nr:aminotransferase class V-fold PLP-dependent enzyme [Enterocloster lavalensis]RHR57068.1 aminotransferase class V-fold PLP-dependent enzyme [Clostridium sp. AF18-27]